MRRILLSVILCGPTLFFADSADAGQLVGHLGGRLYYGATIGGTLVENDGDFRFDVVFKAAPDFTNADHATYAVTSAKVTVGSFGTFEVDLTRTPLTFDLFNKEVYGFYGVAVSQVGATDRVRAFFDAASPAIAYDAASPTTFQHLSTYGASGGGTYHLTNGTDLVITGAEGGVATASIAPEPSTVGLALIGLAGATVARLRRRRGRSRSEGVERL